MRIETIEDITPAVLAVMARTRHPRAREILVSLVKHLHGFAREVKPTEGEFQQAAGVIA